MIIKAKKNLTEPLDLGSQLGAKDSFVLLPGKSIEVNDELSKSPIIQKAIANGLISISNYCGFIIGEGVYKITISATFPLSPRIGDLWVDVGGQTISALLYPLSEIVPDSFDGIQSHLQVLTELLKGATFLSVALSPLDETVPDSFEGLHAYLQLLTKRLKEVVSIIDSMDDTVPDNFDGIYAHLQLLTKLLKG